MKTSLHISKGTSCLGALAVVVTAWAQEPDPRPLPPPGSTGNAQNVPHIGGRDANGNPVRLARKTGHVSNYDEAMVREYTLPDPLKMADGRIVDSAEQWLKKRRHEILAWYETHIYGQVPTNAPQVTWRLIDTNADGTQQIDGQLGDDPDGPKMRLTLDLPKDAKAPVPVLLNLSFSSGGQRRPGAEPARFDPRSEVLRRGWAYAQIGYGDIQPDRADRWQEGVIGLTLTDSQKQPASNEWGTISAWAWGASRTIDYLETVDSIDADRIAVTGASRLGKTVLWAAAKDERIDAVFSVVPGEMGASLIRRDWGETLDDMAQNFPWQFAGNLQNWVGKWNELPIDQHMLIALIAPRPVYVNGGVSDQWSDPKGEFLAMVAAAPVYELLGAGGLGTREVPELDRPVISSHLAFHYHSQGHQAVPEDWKLFLDFAEKHYASRLGWELPKGVIEVVLDSDMYNEVDDQFALAFAVRSPQRIRLRAVHAAPFLNHRSSSARDGMEKSYKETFRVLKLLDEPAEGRVFRGSERFLPDRETPVDSAAARHLIELAHESREGRLCVVGLGAASNIASALLLDPGITERIVVVWIGGHPHSWSHARDFNLKQDIAAAQVLFESRVPLIHVPAGEVAASLEVTLPELEEGLKGRSPIADMLYANVDGYYREVKASRNAPRSGAGAWRKVIWDIATIAWLLEPEKLVQTKVVPSPILTDKGEWRLDSDRHPIRVATGLDRDAIFEVLFDRLDD